MSEVQVKTMVVGMVVTNCYLVFDKETKRAVVIDPGDRPEEIRDEIKELGIKPEAILLTHGHFDHMMGVPMLRKEWNIPVYACEKEKEVLSDSDLNLMRKYYRRDLDIVPDVTFRDNDILDVAGFSIRALETPGHTIGSASFYFEKEGMIFVGDTMFRESYGRVDLPTGSTDDMLASFKKLLQLPDHVTVYPGHMEKTTIEHEKQFNPLARFCK